MPWEDGRISLKSWWDDGGNGVGNYRLRCDFLPTPARDTPPSVKEVDCLVEGRINPYLESTRKLEFAREYDIPIIGPDEFLQIYENEKKLRKRKRR